MCNKGYLVKWSIIISISLIEVTVYLQEFADPLLIAPTPQKKACIAYKSAKSLRWRCIEKTPETCHFVLTLSLLLTQSIKEASPSANPVTNHAVILNIFIDSNLIWAFNIWFSIFFYLIHIPLKGEGTIRTYIFWSCYLLAAISQYLKNRISLLN